MEEGVFFVLPFLLEAGLLNDDSSEYAFTTYPRSIASGAAKMLVADLGKRFQSNQNAIDLKKKKRVKLVHELLPLVLSLEIPDSSLMIVAASIYSYLLGKISEFGDLKRQNKFIRRFFKHLSLPFGFKKPSNLKIIPQEFYAVLIMILDIYSDFHVKSGVIFEDETWDVLFRVIVGINDVLLNYQFDSGIPKGQVFELCQKSCSLFFSIAFLSGIRSTAFWGIFESYCKKWSGNLNFIVVWDAIIIVKCREFCDIVLGKAKSIPLEGGKYQQQNVPKDQDFYFIFQKVLYALDPVLLISNHLVLSEFATTMVQIMDIFFESSNGSSSLFSIYFPGSVFYKLFGPYLTAIPLEMSDDSFSSAIADLISVYLLSIGRMHFIPEDETPKIIINRVLNVIRRHHSSFISSFLLNVGYIFSKNALYMPYLASQVLDSVLYLDTKKPDHFLNNPSFYSLSCSAIVSSVVLNSISKANSINIEQSFSKFWKSNKSDQCYLPLLSSSIYTNVSIINYLFEFISDGVKSEVFFQRDKIPLLLSLVQFVSVMIRYQPNRSEDISKALNNAGSFISVLLASFTAMDQKTLSQYEEVIIYVIIMLHNIIVWGNDIFNIKSNAKSLYDFVNKIRLMVQSDSSGDYRTPERLDRASRRNSIAVMLSLQNKPLIFSLLNNLLSVAIHNFPVHDHYSRKLQTSSVINENQVISNLSINNPIYHYFTIDNSILVTFIESKSNPNQCVFISRGPFGKSIWVIEELFIAPKAPSLSNTISPVPLSPIIHEDHSGDSQQPFAESFVEFQKQDILLSSSLEATYSKWLDWEKLRLSEVFNTNHEYQRARVIDFLLGLGIVDVNNTLKVCPQQNIAEIQKVITTFDSLDELSIIPIPVIHILSCDSKIEFSETMHSRMTESFHSFMSSIGEPFEIQKGTNNIPGLRSSVPLIPGSIGFGAIISPSMAHDIDGARLIFETSSRSPICIIYNESNYDLCLPPTGSQQVIVIRPLDSLTYYVSEPNPIPGQMSPFTSGQVLMSKNISFNLALCFEQKFLSMSPSFYEDIYFKRKETLNQLPSSIYPETGTLFPVLFDTQ